VNLFNRPVIQPRQGSLVLNSNFAGDMLDAVAYQQLQDLAAGADAEEGISQGLDDVARGRTHPATDVF
jgi:hypothetical protein